MTSTTDTTTRRVITASDAPVAIGPYSHAIVADGVLYCSGALPVHPATGDLVSESLGDQTRQCLLNLQAVCAAAQTSLDAALRLTIYTTSLEGFAEINDAYGAFFPVEPPARVTIGVAALPKGARVEIDALVVAPR